MRADVYCRNDLPEIEAMGLDDREQRILEEIERQFYDEDPDLADAVRNITRIPMTVGRQRFASVLAIAGLIFLVWMFPRSTLLAAVGFVVMVGSVFAIVQGRRPRVADRERATGAHADD